MTYSSQNTNCHKYLDKIFNQLQEFRQLPTYQFERRIDAFIQPYLQDFINDTSAIGTQYRFVYPEFPLSVYGVDVTINQTLHSYYADYLFYSETEKKALFVEFKIDSASVGKEQFMYYCSRCEEGWEQHLNFFVNKAKNKGPYQKKFAYGLYYLKNKASYLVGCNDYDPDKKLFEPKVQGLNEHIQKLRFNPPKDITLLFKYLAPIKAESKINDFVEEERRKGNDKVKHYAGFLDIANLADFTPDPLKKLLQTIK